MLNVSLIVSSHSCCSVGGIVGGGTRGVRPIVWQQHLRGGCLLQRRAVLELVPPLLAHACSDFILAFPSASLWYSMFISLSSFLLFLLPFSLALLALCHVLCTIPAFLRQSRWRATKRQAGVQITGSCARL